MGGAVGAVGVAEQSSPGSGRCPGHSILGKGSWTYRGVEQATLGSSYAGWQWPQEAPDGPAVPTAATSRTAFATSAG